LSNTMDFVAFMRKCSNTKSDGMTSKYFEFLNFLYPLKKLFFFQIQHSTIS
jgi:hypothetical protein